MFKRCVCILAVVSAIGTASLEARERWTDQRDAQFGFSYSFPESLFSSAEGDGKPGFHYFAANPVDAKFLVGAGDNREDATPEHFKRWMITNAGGYEELTYQPRGRSWFVLSGYRGEQIYYEKVMFSCGGRIVNILPLPIPPQSGRFSTPSWSGWKTLSNQVANAHTSRSGLNGLQPLLCSNKKAPGIPSPEPSRHPCAGALVRKNVTHLPEFHVPSLKGNFQRVCSAQVINLVSISQG